MSSRFTHIVACVRIPCSSRNNTPLYACTILFIHSSVELFSFHLSAIVNKVVMNMSVQIFLWISTLNQFSSVQSLSCVRLFVTPWTAAYHDSLFITNSQSLLKLMSIKSNHLILCCPLLLLPSVFPSIRFFSKESVLSIRWPKYWSFSFSVSPSNEYSGLVSFRIDWFDLLLLQGTFKSTFNISGYIPWSGIS